MRHAIRFLLGLTLLGAWACAPGEEPPVVSQVDSPIIRPTFDNRVLDTIVWSSAEDALARGRAVFEANCMRCHGLTGAGEGGYVFGGQTLQPPSWLVADWRFAEEPIALRSYIYSGSVGGMPYWGLAGVSYRDIDAVARYVVEVLRPTYGESR